VRSYDSYLMAGKTCDRLVTQGPCLSALEIKGLYIKRYKFICLLFTALHGMQSCIRGLAMRFLSVGLSVCLSNACIVTEGKTDVSRFLYHAKEHSVYFYEKKNGGWGRPVLSEILGQPAPVGAKSPILNR